MKKNNINYEKKYLIIYIIKIIILIPLIFENCGLIQLILWKAIIKKYIYKKNKTFSHKEKTNRKK